MTDLVSLRTSCVKITGSFQHCMIICNSLLGKKYARPVAISRSFLTESVVPSDLSPLAFSLTATGAEGVASVTMTNLIVTGVISVVLSTVIAAVLLLYLRMRDR